MKKIYVAVLAAAFVMGSFITSCTSNSTPAPESTEAHKRIGKDGYDGPMERNLLEIEKTKDPALGYVPTERLYDAMISTEALRNSPGANNLGMIWSERGPIYDSVGPSNGNGRGGSGGFTFPNTYTSGRMRAILIDPADATGNTVFVGGVGGGIWKTSNFLSAIPLWVNINDFFDNLAISSICQDPTNLNTMYFSTGEPTANADAILGKGIWKSTDHGVTWSQLPATTSYTRAFKVICDASGNVYVALRAGGVKRSTDGGATFTDISPSGYSATSCTDIEITGTGTMLVSLGYYTSSGTSTIRSTATPSTVTAAGWSTPAGLPASSNRLEMAATGSTVYFVATSATNNIYASYKSVDDGASFTRQNISNYTSFTNTQGWFDISLDINPNNTDDIIMGQLDAYRSTNGGASVSRLTYWASSAPYAHADHHYVKLIPDGLNTRIVVGTDGGIFYSGDNGLTFIDKNRNLSLKQFYSCVIHPTLPNYFLAGAQDNGTHRLTQPGLSYSHEITGGDGAYVDIDQDEPQYQFGAYVYNQYKRSINGGNNWSNFYFSGSAGLFINPFDYDDLGNKLYGSYGTGLFRWSNPTTASSVGTSITDVLTIPGSSGNVTAIQASPWTPDRLFVGTSGGKLFRIENAGTIDATTILANTFEITGPAFAGYLNCISIGDNDQTLLAVFTNYGVNNVFRSIDGGANWTAIDGNLPDMPVRWGVFAPGHTDKIVIATEAGVYVARSVNGGSTTWLPSPEFPMVKTNMIKVRRSDELMVAATHGRGLWSAYTPTVIPVKDVVLQANAVNGSSNLSWTQVGATNATKFIIQYSINGVSFSNVATVANTVSRFAHQLSAPVGYYRIMATEPNAPTVYSNTVVVKSSKIPAAVSLRISPNPVVSSANFVLSTATGGVYNWVVTDAQGRTVQTGKGQLNAGGSSSLPVNVAALASGSYHIKVLQADGNKVVTAFIKR